MEKIFLEMVLDLLVFLIFTFYGLFICGGNWFYNKSFNPGYPKKRGILEFVEMLFLIEPLYPEMQFLMQFDS